MPTPARWMWLVRSTQEALLSSSPTSVPSARRFGHGECSITPRDDLTRSWMTQNGAHRSGQAPIARRKGASDPRGGDELSLASAVGARPKRLDRLPVAGPDRIGRPREGRRRGRGRRRHVKSQHLREGARAWARLRRADRRQPRGERGVFRELAMRDVATGCDLLRPVWDGHDGGDGYVSIEVDPSLADEPRPQSRKRRTSTRRSPRPT